MKQTLKNCLRLESLTVQQLSKRLAVGSAWVDAKSPILPWQPKKHHRLTIKWFGAVRLESQYYFFFAAR